MATYWQYSAGGSNGHTLYLEINRTSYNIGANTSTYQAKLRIERSGSSYMIANASYAMGINGSQINGGSSSYDSRNVTIFDWQGSVTVGHDANGNASFNVYGYFHTSYSGAGTTGNMDISQTFNADRLPLAPTMNNPTASNVAQTTATISGSAANNGHGTSTTVYLQYKKTTDGSWTTLGAGGTQNLTGLTPGTQYQVQVRGVNNNGDDSGYVNTQTFTTQPAVGMIPLMLLLAELY